MINIATNKATSRSIPKILLVEDNIIAQMMNKDALERAGYQVEVSGSGKQTLAMTACRDYALIFMDIDLPDSSGIEITSQIRRNNSSTPIIALTTANSATIKKQCLAAGMNAFARKPISGAKLDKLVQQYCR